MSRRSWTRRVALRRDRPGQAEGPGLRSTCRARTGSPTASIIRSRPGCERWRVGSRVRGRSCPAVFAQPPESGAVPAASVGYRRERRCTGPRSADLLRHVSRQLAERVAVCCAARYSARPVVAHRTGGRRTTSRSRDAMTRCASLSVGVHGVGPSCRAASCRHGVQPSRHRSQGVWEHVATSRCRGGNDSTELAEASACSTAARRCTSWRPARAATSADHGRPVVRRSGDIRRAVGPDRRVEPLGRSRSSTPRRDDAQLRGQRHRRPQLARTGRRRRDVPVPRRGLQRRVARQGLGRGDHRQAPFRPDRHQAAGLPRPVHPVRQRRPGV